MDCIRFFVILPFVVLLAGCGGSDSGSSGSTRVAFVADTAYNGSRVALTAPPTTGSAVTQTNVTIQSGVRILRFRIPSGQVDPGQVFTIGSGGALGSYDEDNLALWKATGGRIEVTSVRHGKVSVLLAGLTFVPVDNVQSNVATGDFSLSGPVAGIPFSFDPR